ncbi:MAG: phage holin family protein [Bryobacteraceae bacterium]
MNNNNPASHGGSAIGLRPSGASEQRSVVEIIKDIALQIQEIVRGEIRLAATEMRQEAKLGWISARLLIAGALVAFLAAGYLLLAAVFGLMLVLPAWASAAIVGGVLSLIAWGLIASGLGKWKKIQALEKTTETVGDNVAWLKEQSRS